MWTPSIGEILPFLSQLLHNHNIAATSPRETPPLPFTGGWLGWLGFDTAAEIEQLPHPKSDQLPFPVAYWYEPANFAVLDHQGQTLWLAATEPEQLDVMEQRLGEWETGGPGNQGTQVPGDQGTPSLPVSQSPRLPVTQSPRHPVTPSPRPPVSPSPHPPVPLAPQPLFQPPEFQMSQMDYEEAVNQAKKYIAAGDIFQANLSVRFTAATSADGWAIYQALQQINPSPFACYFQTPWGEVISCSPERLVQLQDRIAQTRPIAGTRSRGATPEIDQALARELLASPKERAEHVMLVDLERNDLGRVCQWGSVAVNELFTIERYSHVMHLVSNVIGTLRPECDAIDLIRATFPGGTITGCPKVRCMEIIAELEPVARSLFYGSCGYIDGRGNLDLNILIRTLLFPRSDNSPRVIFGQVGAGIVADSNPEQEWYESLHKAKAQVAALEMALRGVNNQGLMTLDK
ncbi:MAG: anthranilate synthase component I [Oscillatoriaceae cyanobacterium]